MFAAVSVSTGQARVTQQRPAFPEMKEDIKKLYEKAFGKTAAGYPEVVNGLELIFTEERFADLTFNHAPYHDVESYFWVLFYFFIRAHPVDDSENMTAQGERYLKNMQRHEFQSADDSRLGILTQKSETDLVGALSPSLQKLVPFLHRIRKYVRTEWAAWSNPKLPLDHAHEAVKRILFEAIVMLEKEGDPIRLTESWKKCTPPQVVYHSSTHANSSAAMMNSPTKKRTHDSTGINDDNGGEKRRSKTSSYISPADRLPELVPNSPSLSQAPSPSITVPSIADEVVPHLDDLKANDDIAERNWLDFADS